MYGTIQNLSGRIKAMICKCPKCDQYTSGVVNRILYAAIIGRQSSNEVEEVGGELANNVNKIAKQKLGKYFGETIGKVGKGAIHVVSSAVGQARSLAHSVASLMEPEDFYCFQCQNNTCKHEWIEPKKDAIDLTSEFYAKCTADFIALHGRKYLVVNPDASIAYVERNNTFMLQELPAGISLPENAITYGEIYVSHPADPTQFFSLETYRIRVLEDELNDLKQFLLKLGASSIEITGMTDQEMANANKSKVSNSSKVRNAAIEGSVDAYSEREDSAYRRLRTRFQSKVKGERQESPILDTRLFDKWRNVNREWERILEMRISGSVEYSFCIETESITNSKKMELDKVSASYSEFGMGANNEYAKETISKLKEAKRMSFTINVEFYPKSAYPNFQLIER